MPTEEALPVSKSEQRCGWVGSTIRQTHVFPLKPLIFGDPSSACSVICSCPAMLQQGQQGHQGQRLPVAPPCLSQA